MNATEAVLWFLTTVMKREFHGTTNLGGIKPLSLLAIVPALFLSLWQPGPVMSQQEAVYNLASIQPDKHIEIESGGQGSGLIYFYNVDGNRATHIKLEVSRSPENWEVQIQPSPQEIVIDTANGSISLIENLCVEPSTLQSEKIIGLSDGSECVAVTGRGYAVAKVAYVTIWVPESVKAGDTGEVVVTAEAMWLGQSGAASIRQTREFVFSVELLLADSCEPGEKNRVDSVAVSPTEKKALILTLAFSFILIISLLGIAKSTNND